MAPGVWSTGPYNGIGDTKLYLPNSLETEYLVYDSFHLNTTAFLVAWPVLLFDYKTSLRKDCLEVDFLKTSQ